jgi:CybS, succinate dehydrogenase cytochrome B small subunit
MESIVMDYLRPRVVGKASHYAGLGFIYLLSFATFAGLIYLNYSQMPPTKAIKKLWAL